MKIILSLLLTLMFIQFGNTQTCYITNTGTTYHNDSSCGRLRSINVVSYEKIKHAYKPCSTKKCSVARKELGIDTTLQPDSNGNTVENIPTSSSNLITSGRYLKAYNNSIKLLTWNIQDLGRTKDVDEIDAIVNVLRNFDLVAIQEVVSKDPAGAQKVAAIADLLNRTGSQWDYRISDPTDSPSPNIRERYAYLWKTAKLTLLGRPELDSDLAHICDREPYLAEFKTKQGYTFHTVNFHSRPHNKNPESEVTNFSNYPQRLDSKNVVILGDFNMDENNTVWKSLYDQGFEPSVRNSPTTLKHRCDGRNYLNHSIDNIYINASSFHVEDAGRVDIVGGCNNLEIARGISDHLPVYSIIRFL
ncbi:MAG: endonuclease/exonuclease/phosphatase family protein [Saprospiraceae bacterium]